MKAALALFNERGEAHVSLAQIAGRLGISEGNLWYHFRTKRDLVTALFAELEQHVDGNLARTPPEDGSHLAGFVDYAQQSFRSMWEYRFLYRHRFDPEQESELVQRISELTERGHGHVERILEKMVDRGLLRASTQEISELAVNAWIISRYWLDYLQARHGLAKISETDIRAGLKQIVALYRPYLTEAARAELEAARAEEAAPKKRARG